jgi:predicted O-methyltransferase YrrM
LKRKKVSIEKISFEEIEQFILAAGSDSLQVFGGTYEGGIHIQQVPDELAACIKAILDSGQPTETMLEIGVAAGGTTFVLNYFFKFEWIAIVDDNNHPKANLRPDVLKGIEACKRQEYIGNSQDEALVKKIWFGNANFDLLLIDGDHSYRGAITDINSYLPLLKDGGFLVLHDSVTTIWGCEVPKVVVELKTDPRVEFVGEYVSTKHPSPCGLALFRKVAA